MSELRRIMMMFPRPEGSTPVTVDGYVAFLSDFSDMVSGSRIATDGSVETLSGWSISGYIEIPDDARYVYYDEDIDDQYTGLYDSSKTYIGHITKGNAVPLSAKYLRVSMLTNNISDGIIVILKEQREIHVVLPYDAQVEYLQSSGTQYINTGIYGTENLKVEIKVQELAVAHNFAVFGVFGINNKSYYIFQNASGNWEVGMGAYASTSKACDTNEHVFLFNNFTISCDGTTIATINSNTFTTLYPLLLFNMYSNSGGLYSAKPKKVFYCKMWNNGTLVRDLIPVRKDGVGYMYDKVSGELLGNNGTGSFTYGNDVTN